MSKLQGKVAIVSGSGRGIGQAIATKLASEGASVVINDLDPEPAAETAARIISAGGQATTVVGSIADEDVARRFVHAAVDTFGGLDIIVNNAGYTWHTPLQNMTDEQWAAVIDVHLNAPFRVLRAAQPIIAGLVEKSRAAGEPVPCRKVVNISSLAGLLGNAEHANYSAAKAGIIGLTKAVMREWGPLNVTSNAVAFGWIKTRLVHGAHGEGASTIEVDGREIEVGVDPMVLGLMEQMTPLGRQGDPSEAAGAVYLLCTPEADFITGHTLVCSGGFMG